VFSFGPFVPCAQNISSLTLQGVSPSDVWSHSDQQVGFDLQVGPENNVQRYHDTRYSET